MNTALKIAQKVAPFLDGWCAEPLERAGTAALRNGNMQLYIRDENIYSVKAGRIAISRIFPRDRNGRHLNEYMYGDQNPAMCITCAVKRGALAIANDINRRLLPGYADALAQLAALHRERAEREDAQTAMVAHLAQIGNATISSHNPNHIHGYHDELGSWSAEIGQAGTIYKMEIHSIDPETAEKIIRIIRNA